jgi:hypothetical protein
MGGRLSETDVDHHRIPRADGGRQGDVRRHQLHETVLPMSSSEAQRLNLVAEISATRFPMICGQRKQEEET